MKYFLIFDINCYDGLNVQVMIKTRGFGWALERVLGREDNRDSDEAPQRQRHTTSACRQRETILVAKDVHHMDDAVDEVFQQPQEVVVDA